MSAAGCVKGSSNLITDDVDWKMYYRFHHYDFENDKSFQQGLQKVKEIPNFSEADILKAKIFYFSKTFQPVNMTDYNTWLKKETGDSSTAECTVNQSTPGEDETIKSKSTETREITVSVSESGKEDINTKNNEPHCKTIQILTQTNNFNDQSKGDNSTDLSDNLEKILSLADVAEFIEKGLPLPGIKDLDIKPLEIDPQPSTLQRKNKPWEN